MVATYEERSYAGVKVLKKSPVVNAECGRRRVNDMLNGWDGVSVVTDTVGPSETKRMQLVNANADKAFLAHVSHHFRPINGRFLSNPDKRTLNHDFYHSPVSKSFFYDWYSTDLIPLIRYCISQSTNTREKIDVDHFDHSQTVRYRFEFNHELHAAIGWDEWGDPHCHGIKIIVDHYLPTAQDPDFSTRFVTAYPINFDFREQYDQYHNPFVILEPRPHRITYYPSTQDGNGWSEDEWST